MKNIRQKRVVKLKRRSINIGIRKIGAEEKNIIIYGNRNKRITEEELKSIKQDLERKTDKFWGKPKILISLNKTLTLKGILSRMGKGRGKLKTRAVYLTPNMPCVHAVTLWNPSNEKIIIEFLNKFISKYTYFSFSFI